jgi:hypothetical protein
MRKNKSLIRLTPGQLGERHGEIVNHIGGQVDDGQVGDVVELGRKRDKPVAVSAQDSKADARANFARKRFLK